MQHVRLGSSGLEVSPIILGCLSYGEPGRGTQPWTFDLDQSRPYIRQALELGISTFDTANVYSDGSSEEIVGQLLKELARREDVVIATKLHGRMRPGPNAAGLSRTAILNEVDASLRRLGTDYIDLYQVHRFDPEVPMAETMETLHDIVKAGKVRYLGASSMFAWQFAELQATARLGGWTQFISMQDQYNLISREEEREMHPYCMATGVGVMPWAPLARGKLSRDWGEQGERAKEDAFGQAMYKQSEDSDRRVSEAVARVAAARGVSRSMIALAWVANQPAVTAPIVGATRPVHLAEALAAIELKLTPEELHELEQHYVPRHPEGF